jgi:crotonobetaine/carnitine-CoA ligase
VGIPSELEGDDDIKVYVVVRAGAQVDCLELLRHCALSLPPFMVPRYFELVDELPRTPTAKIQKALLRSRGVTPDTWDRRVAGIDLREFLGQLTHASLPTPAGT